MYKCETCGVVFDMPDETLVRENLDGERGVWDHVVKSCPYCWSEFIEEVKDDG